MDVCQGINDVIVSISTRIYRILARFQSVCWKPWNRQENKQRYEEYGYRWRSKSEDYDYRRRNNYTGGKNYGFRCMSLVVTQN